MFNLEVYAVGKKQKKLRGSVQKIIPAAARSDAERAQIDIEGAEELYREIRIANTLEDQDGNEASLKEGAEVDVIVEADSNATVKLDTRSRRRASEQN